MFRKQRGSEFYGTGIIKNLIAGNIDNISPLINEIGNDKQVLNVDRQTKVHKDLGKNHFEDYQNESVDKGNGEEKEELSLEEALKYLEANPNENLDFDDDGKGDFNFGSKVNNEKSALTGELLGNENQLSENPVQSVMKDASANNELMDQPKSNPLEINTDLKLNNTDTMKDSSIKASDMLTIGGGVLALALMAFSKNM